MRIIREKTVKMTAEEILKAVRDHSIPAGITIDINDDTVTVSPEDKINLFGEITDDYELIYYEED